MSAGDTPNVSGASRFELSKELDLSTADGHARTVEWVRNNVILPSKGEKAPAIKLEVTLPEQGHVTLFMDPKDQYILGFRGRDKIYLLNDTNRGLFAKHLLDQKLVAKEEDITNINQGADHPALGTLGRSFALSDLTAANRLSNYSSSDAKQTYEDIKGPLSVLVCMIAESARLKSMELGFREIYLHKRIKANDAIHSYKAPQLWSPLSPEESNVPAGYAQAHARDFSTSSIPAANSPFQLPAPQSVPGGTVRFDVPKLLIGLFVLLAVSALGAIFWYSRTDPTAAASRPLSNGPPERADAKRLALQVARRGNDLLINWDRNIPTAIGARHGVLQIVDGVEPTHLVLSPKDLTSGQVLYLPHSEEVEIQLTVFTDSTSVHEIIRVIKPNPGRTEEATRTIRIPTPQLAPAAKSVPRVEYENPQQNESAQQTRNRFIPPATAKRPESTGQIVFVEPPPPVSAAASAAGQVTALLNTITVPPSTAGAPPPQPAPSTIRSATSPPPTLHANPAVIPPRPVKQAQPLLPRDFTTALNRRVDVQIRTFVDAGGRVTKAEMVEPIQRGGIESVLATAALQAARLWTFTPAMRGTEKMPSVVVLQFTFAAAKPR